MFKEQIIKNISNVTGLPESEVQLEVPEKQEFGDYSSNIALQTFENAKLQKPNAKLQSPRDFADYLVTKLQSDGELIKIVDKITVAGPGFINFFIKKDVLVDTLLNITSHKFVVRYSELKGKRVMLEFGQPNTHKLPHIGHLFSYVLGFSLSNLLEANGAAVRRVNYQGDVGPHVAKCLWAFKKYNPKTPKSLEEKVKLLQEMYQKGSKAYDEDEKAKEEINKINKAIFAKDQEWMLLWEKTRNWNIKYYKEFEKRLGVKFDRYYFESEVYENGKEIVEKNLGNVFTKSEGALIFEGSKYGLHDRVFVTKYDTPTYEAKDLYLENLKMKEWPMDELIITTANEQNEYFKVVYKALELLNPDFVGKLKHIGFGMVNLTTGKMSSRTGEFIGAVELVNMTIAAIKEIISKREELSEKEKEDISEAVGIGAIKYAFLKSNPLQNIKFDLKESVSLEGNSGPYLQYTYARTQSVLAKIPNSKYQIPNKLEINTEELSLLRTFVHFPEVVAEAAKKYSPNLVCNYLYDLAQKYNTFYNKHRILDKVNSEQWTVNSDIGSSPNTEHKTPNTKIFRLALTSATGNILKTGLNLLGIKSPEKM